MADFRSNSAKVSAWPALHERWQRLRGSNLVLTLRLGPKGVSLELRIELIPEKRVTMTPISYASLTGLPVTNTIRPTRENTGNTLVRRNSESCPMVWTPGTPEFETGRLLLKLSTKLGNRIPNEKPAPQPAETMAYRRDLILAGHPDVVVRSLSSEYNCVGMVFGSRRTAIEPELVPRILHEDGYERVPDESDLVTGDVIVYKTDNNQVGHVGVIAHIRTTIYPPSRKITVLSQWGFHGEYLHDINDVDPEYGTRKEFWTDRK